MKNFILIIAVMLLALLGCSREYPSEADLSNTLAQSTPPDFVATEGIQDLLPVFRAKGQPVIDGRQDQLWRGAPRIGIRNNVEDLEQSPISDPGDLSACFRVMWDDDNLYLFVEVVDDELNGSSPNLWENDGIQVYFDGDNSKNAISDCSVGWPGAYDLNDNQLTAAFGQDIYGYPIRIDPSTIEIAYRQQYPGYTIEAALPFEVLLFPGTKDHHFGFEIQVNDNDQGVRQNCLLWSSEEGPCFWLAPGSWGTAVLTGKR